MLNIAHSLLHLAFNLLRNAFRLLGFVTSQLSNLLLDFAGYVFGSTRDLITIHGASPLVRHIRTPKRYCDQRGARSGGHPKLL